MHGYEFTSLLLEGLFREIKIDGILESYSPDNPLVSA